MEKEEKHNPNFHECLKPWSELPVDLLSSVLERLGFADFKRGKSVCSSWYSALRQFVPKNQNHWLILFHKDNNSCSLFNPEEKDKLYKSQDLGLEFSKSVCIATYGSWFLMRDPRFNLYIVNLFTQERINLPPMESQLGTTKIERTLGDGFRISNYARDSKGIAIRSPVFWIDEKTKDYVVLWVLKNSCVVYSKKGDTFWNQIPETSDFYDMVYKDHKLYFLSRRSSFKIFDFSRENPQETFQCGVSGVLGTRPPLSNSWRVFKTKLVVTVTGDVLMVDEIFKVGSIWYRTQSFRIYKVYSSGLLTKCEKVDSLCDEAILFDQGITVLANDIDGFSRNSIYFDGRRATNFFSRHRRNAFSRGIIGETTEFSFFNLKTQKIEQLHKFDFSSIQFSRARWFLPSFMPQT